MTNSLKFIFLFVFVCFIYTDLFSAAPVSIHKDWTLFKTTLNKKGMCYIASLPIVKAGNYKKRGEPYVMVTREEGADYDEVSVSSGFLYDSDRDIEVSILKRKFPLFSNEEKGWTYDKNDDAEIVQQMKNGAKMYIVGYSKAGTMANDTYSLIGFNDAYKQMLELCK